MQKKNRVLYLTYDGLTDPLGQSQIIPYLSGLAKNGHEITIISFEKESNLITKKTIDEQLDKDKIRWIPLKYTKNPPVLSTIWDIIKLRKFVKREVTIKDIEIIHCRSYITSLVGLEMKRKKQLKFIFDMRGFWADERIDGRLWKLGNPLFKAVYSYFKKKEKHFLTEANHTVSLTQKGKEVIESGLVKNPAPISVIPCCVDTVLFSRNHNNFNISRNDLNISKEALVLGYVGSIGTWYMLPEMIDFFKELLRVRSNAVFLFITKESSHQIEEGFQKKNVPLSSLRIQSGKRHEMPQYIALFDWSIFFIKPLFSKQASSPTKQGEIMSMGVPIICNSNIGDTDQIVKKYNSGVVIENFTNQSYQIAIREMGMLQFDPVQLSDGASDYFGLHKGIKSYEHIYQSCFLN